MSYSLIHRGANLTICNELSHTQHAVESVMNSSELC
jgi:hypothetical protein